MPKSQLTPILHYLVAIVGIHSTTARVPRS